MRHEREPTSHDQGRSENKGSVWDRINPIGFNPPISLDKELFPFGGEKGEDLDGIRLELSREDRRENGGGHPSPKENGQNPDGFEPFVDPQDPLRPPQQEEVLFVNKYNGNFAQRMELNRRVVERVLMIAQLDGQVVLGSFGQSRSRSEAQGDELVAKRFGIFERRARKVEEEDPYRRVVSTPEGWRIEINDQRITEELQERGFTGGRLQKAFTKICDRQLRQGLLEAVKREKLSGEKDKRFGGKLILSLAPPAFALYYSIKGGLEPVLVVAEIGVSLFVFSNYNIVSHMSLLPGRKIDHVWEYFMPLVEIDKVCRTFAYLSPVIGKGRTLVREIREEK